MEKSQKSTNIVNFCFEKDNMEKRECGLEGIKTNSSGESDAEGTVSNRKQRMLQLKAQKAEKHFKGKRSGKNDKENSKDVNEYNEDRPDCGESDKMENDHVECNSDGNVTNSSTWNHNEITPMEKPATLIYCGICGTPPDYCEFGDKWNECRSWIQKNCPYYLSQKDLELAKEIEKSSNPKSEDDNVDLKAGSTRIPNSRSTKSTKKTSEIPHTVTIQRQVRPKKKTMTVVKGLENFDVKLNVAAKLFSKQFACGSTVIKAVSGQPSHIEVQGDVEDDLPDVLRQNFSITENYLIHLPPK